MRIPKDFFLSEGTGESDITVHAGSYHLALRDAGIEMCNIMTYSSILPSCARQVEKPKVLEHGAVMETIMAVSTAPEGTRATAGIIWGWLTEYATGRRHGGLVCEYNGPLTEKEARAQLKESLHELYYNGYRENYMLNEPEYISRSFVPRKKYGTALVSLNFINYQIPVIRQRSA